MIKRLPSRNQRSKGIKVKHVLQIILLLGVSFWLIYQIKHSHDKKKEFDDDDAKLSVRTKAADQILKLGRKDLHPGKDGVNQNEKHEEEDEDENIVEDEENKHEHNEQEEDGNKRETEEKEDDKHEVREQEEEENKHGADEQEEDENKSEEMEDEGRGGDDEIDENDQDKSEVDADRDEEFMDEEKEKEEGDEKDNEDTEDEEKGGLVDNHNTHEAREEHYKGDDASSAVAHETHTTSTETETFSLENSDVNSDMSITKPENETNHSDESIRHHNDSDFKVTEGELTNGTSSNATAGNGTGNNSLSTAMDSSHLNKTATTNSDSQFEGRGNLTAVIPEASSNLTGTGADTSSSSEQNKMVIFSESDQAKNTTVNPTVTGDVKDVQTEGLEQSGNRVSKEILPDSNSKASVKTENRDAAAGDNLGAGELENTMRVVASNETENNSGNLDRKQSADASEHDKSEGNTNTEKSETNEAQNNSYKKENTDTTENDKFKGDTQKGETDESSDSTSTNGTSDSVEHDAIDSSDSLIHKDVTEIRTDLDTLPDIRNDGDNGDETAAE